MMRVEEITDWIGEQLEQGKRVELKIRGDSISFACAVGLASAPVPKFEGLIESEAVAAVERITLG